MLPWEVICADEPSVVITKLVLASEVAEAAVVDPLEITAVDGVVLLDVEATVGAEVATADDDVLSA